MFRKRLLSLAIAAATLGIAILGETNHAEAALRLVVTSGSTTDYFYAGSSTSLSTPSFAIDGYLVQTDTSTSNFAGTSVIGSLSTTANFTGTNTATPSTITFTADVIATVAGLADGQITNAGQITSLIGASLLAYTAPTGTPVTVTADVSASVNPLITGGTLMTQTFYKSPPGTIFAPANDVVDRTKTIPTSGPLASVSQANSGTYNLGQIVTLSGLTLLAGIGDSGNFSLTGTSAVLAPAAVPEPAPIVLALTSLPALGLFWMRRRAQA